MNLADKLMGRIRRHTARTGSWPKTLSLTHEQLNELMRDYQFGWPISGHRPLYFNGVRIRVRKY